MEILEHFQKYISQKQTNVCLEIAHLILTELCKKTLIRAINKITGQNAFHHRSVIVLEDETYLENAAAMDVVGKSKDDVHVCSRCYNM